MNEKILVIDDDVFLSSRIQKLLEREGFVVSVAGTGMLGIQAVERFEPSAIVLDVGLPDLDGFGVCRKVRRSSMVPILMLTARDKTVDEVVGLEVGADDYLTKPFEPEILLARLRALLRRGGEGAKQVASGDVLEVGELVIDLGAYRVRFEGEEVVLALKEYAALVKLARNVGRVVVRDELVAAMWEDEVLADENSLDVHMYRLRKKLKKVGADGLVETVRGVGYSMRSGAGG